VTTPKITHLREQHLVLKSCKQRTFPKKKIKKITGLYQSKERTEYKVGNSTRKDTK